MTKEMTFIPQGVCSRQYNIKVTDGKIEDIQIVGGCAGNLKGISSLINGMNVDDAIERMSGITCGDKGTSCPDQISKALLEMKQQ